MHSINCEINLILTWSSTCDITSSKGAGTFAIADTKLYLPVITLSTQDKAKLLEQLKFDFNRTTNWNKYQSKAPVEKQIQYVDYLIDPSFQGVNRLFVLSFENNMIQVGHTFFLPTVKIKYYNIMIDGQNLFDQPVKKDLKKYDKI